MIAELTEARAVCQNTLRYMYANMINKSGRSVTWRGQFKKHEDCVVAVVGDGTFFRKHVVCVDQRVVVELDESFEVNATSIYDELAKRHGLPLPLICGAIDIEHLNMVFVYGIVYEGNKETPA